MEDNSYREHILTDYLIPIAKAYNLSSNAREEAEKLIPLLEAHEFGVTRLAPCIKYHRSIPDTFVSARISTWSGLLTMIKSGGMLSQFLSAEAQAKKKDPRALPYDQYNLPAWGEAVAAILSPPVKADKKSSARRG